MRSELVERFELTLALEIADPQLRGQFRNATLAIAAHFGRMSLFGTATLLAGLLTHVAVVREPKLQPGLEPWSSKIC